MALHQCGRTLRVRWFRFAGLAVALTAAPALLPSQAGAGHAAVIRFSPAIVNIGTDGEPSLVEIIAENVPGPGLAAFQVDLLFDNHLELAESSPA